VLDRHRFRRTSRRSRHSSGGSPGRRAHRQPVRGSPARAGGAASRATCCSRSTGCAEPARRMRSGASPAHKPVAAFALRGQRGRRVFEVRRRWASARAAARKLPMTRLRHAPLPIARRARCALEQRLGQAISANGASAIMLSGAAHRSRRIGRWHAIRCLTMMGCTCCSPTIRYVPTEAHASKLITRRERSWMRSALPASSVARVRTRAAAR